MNRAHVTLLMALGLFLSVSAYSDKSIYSSAPAAARLRQPAATHRVKSVQVQQPYQVQLQPVAVVAKPQQQVQPTYEKRVPHPVYRPAAVQQVQAPAPQYHYPAPAPAKIEVQAPAPQYHYPAPAKIEVQAPAPQPTYQPAYQQQAIILPAYQPVQPAKVQAAPAYESQSVSEVDTDSHKSSNDDDDDDDDDDEERRHHQQQAPVAFTYPAFDGYKAPAQPAYQAVVFQAPRPASYVTYEAPRPAAIEAEREEEEESYPDDLSAIPGEAGKDYPHLHRLPEEIHFTCDDKLPGYYADVDYKCQVWHSCDTDGRRQSFLCPNGTIYSQEKFVCEWWFNVDCSSSSNYFALNEGLYKVPVRVPEVEQQQQYVNYEQQQPHYTVFVPQQPQQQQVRYEQAPAPAPAPVHKVRVTSHPAPAKYVKSSEQQQQQHTSYY